MKDLVVFIGESGSGKNFLIDHLLQEFPNDFHVVPQVSTRPMRAGEKEGHPYHFVDKSEFFDEIKDGAIIEWQNFNGWYYGTRKKDLVKNKINILSANPAAARTLLKNPKLNTHVVYVKCEDKIRLIRSLEREKYPNVREILRRYDADLKDFKFFDFNYYTLINNNFDDISKIVKIVQRELIRRRTKKDN